MFLFLKLYKGDDFMVSKKFLLGVILGAALCLSSCYNDENEVTETTALTTTAATEVTTTAATTVSEITEPFETVTESEAVEHEQGLVFFVQPIIEQYDEYDEWNLSGWQPRDTDVMHGCHYDGEWKYRKKLIFVFSNYTDEPVTVDSIQIIRETDSEPVSFADGSDTLNIDFTVQPEHKTDYLLQAEDFNYSACESGVYVAVVKSNLDYYRMEFFIDNSELYEEQHTAENRFRIDPDTEQAIPYEYPVYAPMFLNEEQRHIFAQAHGLMGDYFWDEHGMSQSYADTHTADDFMAALYEVFTKEYAERLVDEYGYIDENGELTVIEGGRGSDITYMGHCYLPVSSDEDQVSFKAVVIHAHGDDPYKVWFDEREYHMVNTENGWRVFHFEIWN